MELVSEKVCARTWTAKLVTKRGRLPDLEGLKRGVREAGRQFWVRGVELVIDGELVERQGRPAIRINGSGEVITLSPLDRKVQWDADREAPEPLDRLDREAYARLKSRWRGETCPVRVVGPLVTTGVKTPPILEVREFFWRE